MNATILLVDDDIAIRRCLGEMLERSGYTVLLAGDGACAIKLLQDRPDIDLVIADYRMPWMDGLTLARCIREKHPRTAVIILTGHCDLESYLCSSGLGIDHYMSKPVGLRDLLRAVTVAVSAAR